MTHWSFSLVVARLCAIMNGKSFGVQPCYSRSAKPMLNAARLAHPHAAAGPAPAPHPAASERLPLIVVRHAPDIVPEPSLLRRVLRSLRFVPFIVGLLAVGGFIGLYFQPPGLQKLMEVLQLQPGGGTSSPIAVPVTRQDPRQLGIATPVAARPVVMGLGTACLHGGFDLGKCRVPRC